jgi:L,D-peptidoglycan transpeptidase YkuD (ErfK/YbiS/YcfS/YnhG family)
MIAAGRLSWLLAIALTPSLSSAASAQSCPAPLEAARRLVLVTAETMDATAARMRLYERNSPAAPWRALGADEPATVGRAGMAWSHFFRRFARRGEPIKVDRDKRAPAGVYSIGRSFGTLASSRPDHLHVTADTVCVDDWRSPAYNTITSRKLVGPKVHAENMSRILPMYRRGLLVDYPTDAKARAGSCIFIHVWRSPTTGTAGCVALPESRVQALQAFSEGGAVLAILPRAALGRLGRCLPGTR